MVKGVWFAVGEVGILIVILLVVAKFYIYMMRISFYAGDFELTIKNVENAKMMSVPKCILTNYSPFFDFYSSYISGDYKKQRK